MDFTELINLIPYIDELKRSFKMNDNYAIDEPPSEYIRLLYLLNPQQYGPLLEKYVKRIFNLDSVSPRKGKGDSKLGEHKASYLSINGSYNFIQIRLWEGNDHVFVTIDPRNDFKTYMFYLTKEETEFEIKLLGRICHSKAKHYKITLDPTTSDWNRWCSQYKIEGSIENVDELKGNLEKAVLDKNKPSNFYEIGIKQYQEKLFTQ